MVDKKLSDFGYVQPSDVSDFVVLYLDENNSLKNGRLSFNTIVSMIALLSGNNTFEGENTFSGDVIFEGQATFNSGINGVASRATADANGNNIPNTYATKTELQQKASFNLFHNEWFDYQLNDMSWLRADTFSWQDGTVYSNAYQHLVADITGKTLQSETVGSTTIQFYLADDKHKICPASQESNVSAIYTETGVAWYYIVDTTNTRFKLPRSTYNKYSKELPVKGNGKAVSFTDGTSTKCCGISANFGATLKPYGTNTTASVGDAVISGNEFSNKIIGIATNPTESGIIASSVADTNMHLYFYVGQFSKTATEQTAGITTEQLNQKLDLDVGNATSNTKETIVGWGMPDYSAGVAISTFDSSHPYTMPSDGFIFAVVTSAKELFVNGAEVSYMGIPSGTQAWGLNAYASKNDVITTDATSTSRPMFYPLKGVSNA